MTASAGMPVEAGSPEPSGLDGSSHDPSALSAAAAHADGGLHADGMASCLVCSGGASLAATAWQMPDFFAGTVQLAVAREAGRAPAGDWRRRLRPPSLV
ncbi:hypothetical protein ACYJW8_04595 [Frateuria aurantia]